MPATTMTNRSSVALGSFAVLMALLAVGLELVFHTSLRLPGHRALPGALALILFAESAAPLFLAAFVGAVSALLLLLPGGEPVLVMPWIILGGALLALRHNRFRHGLVMLVGLGLLYGLARAGVLWFGFHKTPQVVRLAGHLFFGGLGGLGAFALAKLGGRMEEKS